MITAADKRTAVRYSLIGNIGPTLDRIIVACAGEESKKEKKSDLRIGNDSTRRQTTAI
jgi:hypothetical protein